MYGEPLPDDAGLPGETSMCLECQRGVIPRFGDKLGFGAKGETCGHLGVKDSGFWRLGGMWRSLSIKQVFVFRVIPISASASFAKLLEYSAPGWKWF